ncbi:aldehyde dehydrogenase domain-containing protein [Talaromyces proteolyticus]|uniref:aldehyde dehydrogenase (NAD(+)) n=1 Tax=Talaromyces proteolyticus TaxID=1131652 RepID=A0AAD4KPN9_9EURO|nr:aldehyde dehydrogenase domain-containing protein [Talaromyces proteolyticus]KAH8697582.1 aldehyde dehydrogenase domain-containing protein [Talaromyces proteolyticus]
MSAPTIRSVAELTKLYINGNYVEAKSGQTYTIYNPSDESVVSDKIPVAGKEDVDAAVVAAEKAFHGPWSKFTGAERSACLRKLAEILDENDRLVDILTLDSLSTGNPVSIIPTREKNYIMSQLLYYAGWTDKLRGDYLPDDDGFVKLVRHEPLGVCAGINPFNAPVATLIMKTAPCLATGNTIIMKPSEYSPLGSLAIAPLFEAAGFPKGVFQVVTGAGDTGALLAGHMRIRKISFTGSVATGRKIQIAATQSNLKRVTLELGGKSPAVVFEDANLDNALTWTINAILARSGQVCVAASRIYVERSIADKFIEGYKERMKAAVNNMGNPLNKANSMGPLVNKTAFERVTKMIERGKAEAELVVGGVRHGDQGCYIEPTVFLNPQKDAQIYKDEVFGPVSVIKTFETEEEVLEMANDTEFGLMSGVFTKDINRALRFSSRLESGVVGVNCVSIMNVQVPFGGKKASGLGREFGEYASLHFLALRSFTEPKTVLIK